MTAITLSVEDSQLVHIAHFDDAADMWKALSKKYERSTFGSRLYLRRKLYNIHYRSGPMSQHIDAIMEVVGLLRGSGKPLEDEEVVAVLLVSLPESYSGLVTALEGRDETALNVEYVTGKILDEYQRRIENGTSGASAIEDDEETALRTSDSYKRGYDKNNKTEKKTYREERNCYFCKKKGHLMVNCEKFKEAQQNFEESESTKSCVTKNEENRCTFIAFGVLDKNRSDTGKWCVDSGASCHMTNDREFFTTLVGTNSEVYLANGSTVKVAGIGEGWITCRLPDNGFQKILIQEVLYVPELDCGLLSVRKITELGFRVTFEKNFCSFYEGRKVVARAVNDGDIFKLDIKIPKSVARVAKDDTKMNGYYSRLEDQDNNHGVMKNRISRIQFKPDRKSKVCECCSNNKYRKYE